jgi:hypothetical protein
MIIVKPYPHPDDWMKEDPKIPLQEMAYPPEIVRQKLTQYENTTFIHLLKLFYFREFTDYFNNWSIAVFKSAFRVSKLSSPPRLKNKNPPAEMIYEWMWGGWEDSFDQQHAGFIRGANDKSDPSYQKLSYIHQGGDESGAYEFMKAYYIWLAKELSKNGQVTKKDVQDEIKFLFKKYPL